MTSNDKQLAGNHTDKATSESLYARHEKVYPRQVSGLFAMWRTIGVFVLLGIYYLAPWFRWEGRQAVLLDLPERKFHIFAITFWPQDFFYFAVLMIIAALSLFFFTAIAGRLWCGFACPQTVWTEVFLWIERRVEGDRMKRMRRDQQPWTGSKVALKATKHTLWILLAAFTGFTFVGYFTPITGIYQKIISFGLGPWETFWIVFYSLATYGNAGWLREQVCIYMCPYARFQSAMFDKDTLIISYDEGRGEPRGSRSKSDDPKEKGLGDCIDCTMCVQVCPTGIDIRQGLQYQCIACAACIDVCDQVMDKVGYEKGLIRYTTEHAVKGEKVKLFRPRIVIYALILIGAFISLAIGLLNRIPLELDVIRDRNILYRKVDTGMIENVYTLKIANKDRQEHSYTLTVAGIPGLELKQDSKEIIVPSGKVFDLPLRVQADPNKLSKQSTQIVFTLIARDNDKHKAEEQARFIGPGPGSR